MGLLQGVITGKLETAYRSLKYKEDSNQPYIVTPIPDYTDSPRYSSGAPDFILRQGALDTISIDVLDRRTLPWWVPGAVSPNALNPFTIEDAQVSTRVPVDALRVGRFLFDDKSIAGALFTVKQNLLERTRVNAPGGPNRVYLPTSTILQAGVNALGFRLNKSGLDPLDLSYSEIGNDSTGYLKTTLQNEADYGNEGNRLVLIYQTKQTNTADLIPYGLAQTLYDIDITNPGYIYSYRGGPSTLGGLGKTRVRIDGTGYGDPKARTNNYSPLSLRPQDKNTYVFGNDLLGNLANSSTSTAISKDFRQIINESVEPDLANNPSKQVLPYTDYVAFNRQKTYLEYTPTTNPDPLNPFTSSLSYDGINSLEVLRKRGGNTDITDEGSTSNPELKILTQEEALIDQARNQDLIPFYFQVINNDSRDDLDADWFLFFRAYINNMSDNFKGDWQSFKYIGRAENFYKYSGFSRDISLSFTIYAHSYLEMAPIYEKLNKLVGVTAPSYSSYNYMRGNFINLRIGDYLNDVPGIITNIGLKPSFEGGWEIGRNNIGVLDPTVKRLPRLIEVDLSFIPIHNFTPNSFQPYIG